MSRWKETLCGSVIKNKNKEMDYPQTLLQQTSDLLTCGGNFTPAPQQNTFKPHRRPAYFQLPTDEYQVLVWDGRGDMVRYGEEGKWDAEDRDWSEDALNYFEKQVK